MKSQELLQAACSIYYIKIRHLKGVFSTLKNVGCDVGRNCVVVDTTVCLARLFRVETGECMC